MDGGTVMRRSITSRLVNLYKDARTPDSRGKGADENYDPDNPRMVRVQDVYGKVHELPEDHPSLRRGASRPTVDTYESRHPFSGKKLEDLSPQERSVEETRQKWRGDKTVEHFKGVNLVREMKANGKLDDMPEEHRGWANEHDPSHPDFKPLTRDVLGYEPHYPEWESEPEPGQVSLTEEHMNAKIKPPQNEERMASEEDEMLLNNMQKMQNGLYNIMKNKRNVLPTKGRGAAAMGGAVNPAMGNPEVELSDDLEKQGGPTMNNRERDIEKQGPMGRGGMRSASRSGGMGSRVPKQPPATGGMAGGETGGAAPPRPSMGRTPQMAPQQGGAGRAAGGMARAGKAVAPQLGRAAGGMARGAIAGAGKAGRAAGGMARRGAGAAATGMGGGRRKPGGTTDYSGEIQMMSKEDIVNRIADNIMKARSDYQDLQSSGRYGPKNTPALAGGGGAMTGYNPRTGQATYAEKPRAASIDPSVGGSGSELGEMGTARSLVLSGSCYC